MPLMTGDEYVRSLQKIKMRIFLFGEEIDNPVGNPILQTLQVRKSTVLHIFTRVLMILLRKLKCSVCLVRRPQPVSSVVAAWILSIPCTAQHMK